MAKIGVKCFAAGNDKENRAERDQTNCAMMKKEFDAIERIDCGEHVGSSRMCSPPAIAIADEPDHHDRTEHGGHFCSAAALRGEQRDQNDDRERHNKFGEGRTGELEALQPPKAPKSPA